MTFRDYLYEEKKLKVGGKARTESGELVTVGKIDGSNVLVVDKGGKPFTTSLSKLTPQ